MTGITLMAVLSCALIVAQPVIGQEVFQTASLNEHNKYRSRHQNTPLMILDADLNNRAQYCAAYYGNKGTIDHSCDQIKRAGENLYYSEGYPVNAVNEAVNSAKAFYDEIRFYDFNNPGFSGNTGHFTQLVWVKSTKLGVGYAIRGNRQYIVNLYREHGNYLGQFPQNVMRLK